MLHVLTSYKYNIWVFNTKYKVLYSLNFYLIDLLFDYSIFKESYATLLLENGANIKDIQKRLGPSKLATTMDTYNHVTDKMKNNTINIFENIAKNLPPS